MALGENSKIMYVIGWITEKSENYKNENKTENVNKIYEKDEQEKTENNVYVQNGSKVSTYIRLTDGLKNRKGELESKVRIAILCQYELEYSTASIIELKCKDDKIILSLATGGLDIYYLISNLTSCNNNLNQNSYRDKDSINRSKNKNMRFDDIRSNNIFYLLPGPSFPLPSTLLSNLNFFYNGHSDQINRFLYNNTKGNIHMNSNRDTYKNLKLNNHKYNNNSDRDSNFISDLNLYQDSNRMKMMCIDRIRRKILIIFMSLPTCMELRNNQKHNSNLNCYSLLLDGNNNSSIKNEINIKLKSMNINNIFDIVPISTTSSSTSFWILDNSCIFNSISTPIVSTLTIGSS